MLLGGWIWYFYPVFLILIGIILLTSVLLVLAFICLNAGMNVGLAFWL